MLEQADRMISSAGIDNRAQAFLWLGRCSKGMRIRLRVAIRESMSPSLPVHVRISRTWRKCVLTTPIACASKDSTQKVSISSIAPLLFGRPRPRRRPTARRAIPVLWNRSLKARIRQVLGKWLEGYFYLSAIRDPEKRDEVEGAAVQGRSVGPRGESTWDQERRFAHNRLRQVCVPNKSSDPEAEQQRFREHDFNLEEFAFLLLRIRAADKPPAEARIWELAAKKTKNKLQKVAASIYEKLGAVDVKRPREDLSELAEVSADDALTARAYRAAFDARLMAEAVRGSGSGEALASFFNDLLPRPELHVPDFGRTFLQKQPSCLPPDWIVFALPIGFASIVCCSRKPSIQPGSIGAFSRSIRTLCRRLLRYGCVAYWKRAFCSQMTGALRTSSTIAGPVAAQPPTAYSKVPRRNQWPVCFAARTIATDWKFHVR